MGSALAKGWLKENSKYKISIIEKEELLLNYKKFTNVKVYKNFNEFFTENKKTDFVVLAIKPQQLNDIKNDIFKFEINHLFNKIDTKLNNDLLIDLALSPQALDDNFIKY